jgi:hypothetical protein
MILDYAWSLFERKCVAPPTDPPRGEKKEKKIDPKE